MKKNNECTKDPVIYIEKYSVTNKNQLHNCWWFPCKTTFKVNSQQLLRQNYINQKVLIGKLRFANKFQTHKRFSLAILSFSKACPNID